MASLALGVRFTPASAGTGDFVYSGAVTGYTNPTGLTDGKTYRYRAESSDLSQWEWGSGTWTAATSTLARTTIAISSTGSKISFTAQPQVAIVIFPADILQFDDAQTLTALQQNQGQKNLGVPTVLRSYLAGLQLSTAGSSSSVSVSAGVATDSTNASMIVLPSAISKTTGAWVAGNSAGGLDTGTIAANSWYAFFAITNTTSGAVDIIFTKEVAGTPPSPTLPSGYTLSRYIGSAQTDSSSNWVFFIQNGDQFSRAGAVSSDQTNPGASAVTVTLSSIPLGVVVSPAMNVAHFASSGSNGDLILSSLALADQTPSSGTASMLRYNASVNTNVPVSSVVTNPSAQIRFRVSASGAGDEFIIYTFGWIDRRGRDA